MRFVHMSREIRAHSFLQIMSKALRFWDCCLATWVFGLRNKFSIGLKSADCLGFLFEPLLCCLGSLLLWVIVVLEKLTTTYFLCSGGEKEVVTQDFMVHGFVHCPIDAVMFSCALSTAIYPQNNVSISMLDSGDSVLCVIVSISLPSNTARWVNAKKLHFCLIWPSPRCSLANFRWTCTYHFALHQNCWIHYSVMCYQWFSW